MHERAELLYFILLCLIYEKFKWSNVITISFVIVTSLSVLAIGLIGQLDQLDIGLIGLVPISPNNQLDNWT